MILQIFNICKYLTDITVTGNTVSLYVYSMLTSILGCEVQEFIFFIKSPCDVGV